MTNNTNTNTTGKDIKEFECYQYSDTWYKVDKETYARLKLLSFVGVDAAINRTVSDFMCDELGVEKYEIYRDIAEMKGMLIEKCGAQKVE